MSMKNTISSILILVIISILLGGCSDLYLKFKTDEARNVIKTYLKSIYENDYKTFKNCTYAESETLKKLSFESLQIGLGLNNSLKKIYGLEAVSDHTLYSQDYYGINDLPHSINYEKISNLKFRKWNGLIGIYEPQTTHFFEFKIKDNRLLVNLQAHVLDMKKHLVFIENSIEYMKRVENQIENGETKGMSIKEFAESAHKVKVPY